MKHHLKLLGKPVIDKVTTFHGVVTCISYDLYGCVQAIVTPKIDQTGAIPDGKWFDVTRLNVVGESVMAVPSFDSFERVAIPGPAEKPIR